MIITMAFVMPLAAYAAIILRRFAARYAIDAATPPFRSDYFRLRALRCCYAEQRHALLMPYCCRFTPCQHTADAAYAETLPRHAYFSRCRYSLRRCRAATLPPLRHC